MPTELTATHKAALHLLTFAPANSVRSMWSATADALAAYGYVEIVSRDYFGQDFFPCLARVVITEKGRQFDAWNERKHAAAKLQEMRVVAARIIASTDEELDKLVPGEPVPLNEDGLPSGEEDWICLDGGDCPVDVDRDFVSVLMRWQVEKRGASVNFYLEGELLKEIIWELLGEDWDIVPYRVPPGPAA